MTVASLARRYGLCIGKVPQVPKLELFFFSLFPQNPFQASQRWSPPILIAMATQLSFPTRNLIKSMIKGDFETKIIDSANSCSMRHLKLESQEIHSVTLSFFGCMHRLITFY